MRGNVYEVERGQPPQRVVGIAAERGQPCGMASAASSPSQAARNCASAAAALSPSAARSTCCNQPSKPGIGDKVQKVLSCGSSRLSCSATRLIRKLPSDTPRSPGWQLLIE